MRLTTGEKIFGVVNNTILVFLALLILYPMFYIISASLSSGAALNRGEILLFPVEFNFSSYMHVLSNPLIWSGYLNTIYYTVLGTIVNLAFTIAGAYPLSKKRLMGGKTIMKFVVFTMWFNPGMIPFYLTLVDYNLLDTRTAIILAFAINTFNVIILKSFFSSVPHELEEAAVIDGANDLQILWKLFLPLSMPAIATVGLFYAVSRWNGFFWAMLIFSSDSLMPLQVVLQSMIQNAASISEFATVDPNVQHSMETVIYATIMVSIVPMLILYPFIQKYFVKGVMIGAVKG